jgi:hypothetical protein
MLVKEQEACPQPRARSRPNAGSTRCGASSRRSSGENPSTAGDFSAYWRIDDAGLPMPWLDASVDTGRQLKHPWFGVRVLHRVSTVLLCLGLIAGNAGVCAGWAATAEERMACCTESGECPMHKRQPHESGSHSVVTQAQADACCAASERDHSNSSNPAVVTVMSARVLGVGVVLPAITPSLVLTDGWRTGAPVPIPPVPRHVLLTVFLV